MKNIFALLTCLLLTLAGIAKTYTVANQDDFKKATDLVTAGDEIVIANGSYTGWSQLIIASGTASKPIIIRGETPGKVIFSGEVTKPMFLLMGAYLYLESITFKECSLTKGRGSTGVLVEMKGSTNCRLTGCTFTKNVVKVQFTPIVIISGKGNHNRVDHCSFIGNVDNQEVQVKITADAVPQYSLIDDNLFKDKDKVTWKVFNGGECVQVGQDPVLLGIKVANSTVRNNKFIHCDGEAEVISNKSSGNRYIANTFDDCHGELVMRGGHDCLIDSNTFKGGSGGIRINGTHHIITNNSLTGLPTGIRLLYGMAKGKTEIGFYVAASNCTISKNIITDAQTAILIGDSKNQDWTGKFDVTKYPSRTLQDVAPFDNTLSENVFKGNKADVVHND